MHERALVIATMRARTAAKLTQADLARRLGTTRSAAARPEVAACGHPQPAAHEAATA